MPSKIFECPHCQGPVPAERVELEAAAAALSCQACRRVVYLTSGRLSNYQPGAREGEPAPEAPSYDSGA